MKVNYFFATWSGDRRQGKSVGNYTYQHLQYLSAVSHNLSKIIIGWPHNSKESREYRQYMESLHGTDLNGVPIHVERCNNNGFSYGQFDHALKQHSDFEYVIFTEDDYVPVLNNFDEALINEYESKDCGFMCGFAAPVDFRDRGIGEYHAAVSWGIFDKESIEMIQARYNGNVPFSGRGDFQTSWSLNIRSVCKIEDVTDNYSVPFDRHAHEIETFGSGPEIFSPIERANELKINGVEAVNLF